MGVNALPIADRPSRTPGGGAPRGPVAVVSRLVDLCLGRVPVLVSRTAAVLGLLCLLAALAAGGTPVDRTGAGVVVEVYPAASLKLWGLLPYRRYKGAANAARLAGLMEGLVRAAPWLEFGAAGAVCARTDHAFDAVLAALTARAAALGRTPAPPERDAGAAATEGWIALPAGPLGDLID